MSSTKTYRVPVGFSTQLFEQAVREYLAESAKVKEMSISALKSMSAKNPDKIYDELITLDSSKNNKDIIQFLEKFKQFAADKIKDVVKHFTAYAFAAKETNLQSASKVEFLKAIYPDTLKDTSAFDQISAELRDDQKKYAKALADINERSDNKSVSELLDYFKRWEALRISNKKQLNTFSTFEQLEAYVDENATVTTPVKKKNTTGVKYMNEADYSDAEIVMWEVDSQEEAIKYTKEATPNTWCIARDRFSGSNLYNAYRIRNEATFYIFKQLPDDGKSRKGPHSGDYSDFFLHVYEGDKYVTTGKPNGDSSKMSLEQLLKALPVLNKKEITSKLRVKPLSDQEKKIASVLDKSYSELKTEEQQFIYAELGEKISDGDLAILVERGRMSVIDAYIGSGQHELSDKVLKLLDEKRTGNYHRVQKNIQDAVEAAIVAEYGPLIVDQ